MNPLARIRAGLRHMPLRYRLPASFAGVALLTMLVLGAILVPLLKDHYARAERSYLAAGAAQAVEDLSAIDWSAVAAEKQAAGQATLTASRSVRIEALSLQLRIQVLDPQGSLLVDSGSVNDIDATGIVEDHRADGAKGEGGRHGSESVERSRLPNPLGSGLFDTEGGTSQSARSTTAQLTNGDSVVADLHLSEAPAYGATVLRTTLIAWLVAGVIAVLLAGLVGWLVSRHLTRPLVAITQTSDRMAGGDLDVRAVVDRDDEIGKLAGSFNAMADTTQKTVGTLRRFVADAAHELGTPLTALQADLELAQGRSKEPGVQRVIGRALRQTERIQHLSADLLRLSRLDRGGMPLALEPIDLRDLTRRLADEVASRAEQAGIDFALVVPTDQLRVKANAVALGTAVGNLLDNALKFTPAGGSVVVGSRIDDGAALIWVDDTGIGILPADLDDLFSRFHRGRNAAGYSGSGLGLAIVKATMELHGGTVQVHSKAVEAQSGGDKSPAGSRFELRLPLA
jgi:two-component system, OmpR family, sensor histidine kinase BaeS